LLFKNYENKEKILIMPQAPTLSFCQFSTNRLFHARYTLPYNLALCERILKPLGIRYEFVFLNYNSKDSLDEWIHLHHQSDMDSGVLKYFHTKEPRFFHMAHAKNSSAKLAQNDVLVWVDCDHYLSIYYLYHLIHWQYGAILNVVYIPPWIDGRRGRVAVDRDVFYHVQGYDEHLNDSWGFEDDDFIMRVLSAGYRSRTIHPFLIGQIIDHDDEVRVQNMVNNRSIGERSVFLKEAQEKSYQNLREGRLIANLNQPWGALADVK
jgi:hypothetical protein